MGYTHYWKIEPSSLASHPEAGRVVATMRAIAAASPVPVDTELRYGYQFEVNGVDDEEQCEPLCWPPRKGFDFSKTRQLPYDVVVTASLAAAKHLLGDVIKVSSDGDASEWERGVALASDVLGVPVANPIGGYEEDEG